uniref:Uncharacterized protein n=1 Tax=Cacopsylla melanoneura TaxID=428564 RepID=A0A8D8TZ85_9HEMI
METTQKALVRRSKSSLKLLLSPLRTNPWWPPYRRARRLHSRIWLPVKSCAHPMLLRLNPARMLILRMLLQWMMEKLIIRFQLRLARKTKTLHQQMSPSVKESNCNVAKVNVFL